MNDSRLQGAHAFADFAYHFSNAVDNSVNDQHVEVFIHGLRQIQGA